MPKKKALKVKRTQESILDIPGSRVTCTHKTQLVAKAGPVWKQFCTCRLCGRQLYVRDI